MLNICKKMSSTILFGSKDVMEQSGISHLDFVFGSESTRDRTIPLRIRST